MVNKAPVTYPLQAYLPFTVHYTYHLQALQYYDATRKSLKWYRKVAVHLLQVAMYNSWVIFGKDTGSDLTFVKFQMKVTLKLSSG